MNKIAIENGLAYVVEYISDNEVEVITPINNDPDNLTGRIIADQEKNSIKLITSDGEIRNLAPNQNSDITVVFKDLIDSMIQHFCMETKFVYIKNGENYTMIGDM